MSIAVGPLCKLCFDNGRIYMAGCEFPIYCACPSGEEMRVIDERPRFQPPQLKPKRKDQQP